MNLAKLLMSALLATGLVGCVEIGEPPTGAQTAVSAAEKESPPKQPIAKVNGGGEASFDFVPGLTSIFGVGANVHADGSANGSFMCLIQSVVVIHGQVLTGALNPDGSVTLKGVGDGIEFTAGGPIPFEECAFEVTLWNGGPGVGHFFYKDCVAPGDAETVTKGQILVH